MQHLSDLVDLGLSVVLLNVHAWVTMPRCREDHVAGPALSRLTEVEDTHFYEVLELDIGLAGAHLDQQFADHATP